MTAKTTTAQAAATTPTTVATIQSAINESAYFRSMRHSFKGSFAFLGELLQNSRRAGASYVALDFEPKAQFLRIEDDGAGISDFSKLVHLCESGWDNNVTLSDNPFGQGFFSVFFACERVTVRSRGVMTSICLDEITSKRTIQVVTDNEGPAVGTVLEMVGLNETILAMRPGYLVTADGGAENYELASKVRNLARGFPIDVRLNGSSLARPHARDQLKGEQTHLGFISCGHIHDDRPVHAMPLGELGSHFHANRAALYLQGLPIQFASYDKALCVVHLDSQVFAPVLPDRAFIFDSDKKLPLLEQALQQMGADFLACQKKALAPEVFITEYWEAAKSLKCTAMFNDIGVLPRKLFSSIAQVCEDRDNRYGTPTFHGETLSLSDIQQGKVVVWRNHPNSVLYDPNEGPILKALELNNINCVDTAGLDKEHWIFKHTPSCSDMVATIEVNGVQGTGNYYAGESEMELQLVDQFTITLTSQVDTNWVFRHTVQNDWVVQAVDDESQNVACYLCTNDASSSWPFETMTDCCDGSNVFDQDWYDRLRTVWTSLISGLKGQSLAASIGAELDHLEVTITDSQIGQMLLLTADRPSTYNRLAVVDLETPEFWDRLAAGFADQVKPDGAALKALFAQAAKKAPEQVPEQEASPEVV